MGNFVEFREYSSIKDQIKAEEQMAALKKDCGDSLEFKGMRFFDYYPNALRELTSLRHLTIYNCHTKEKGHPAWIADLPLLETLNLCFGYGDITELLDNIHKLKHLRKLDIRWNGFKQIGDNFALLENLEELRITGDNVTKFPKVLGRMPKLHTLEIHSFDCSMDDIFSVLANAPKLRKLKAVWWKSPLSIPDSIGKLSQLEELFLECEKPSSVSDCMADMKALKRLTLRMPKLTSLPPRLYEYGQLEHLDIEGCNSLQLHDELCKLPNLKGLNLLKSPNEGLPKLTAQQMAQMEELHIQGPLPDLSPCKQLRTLQYCTRRADIGSHYYHPLRNICDKSDSETAFPRFSFPQLEKLMLHGGKYTDISFIVNSPKLRELVLQCDITCLPNDLGGLTCLESLVLDRTISLKALPDSFVDLVSLKNLYVKTANFHHVPCDLSNLQKLKNVYWCYAKEAVHTAGITEALYTIPNLEKLRIDKVQDFMPDGISKLKKLRKLRLALCHTATHYPQDLGQLEELDELEIYPYASQRHADECALPIPRDLGELEDMDELKIYPHTPLYRDDTPLPTPLPDLSGLKKLVSCIMGGYRIPPSLFTLPNLKFLVIAGQNFEELPELLCNLPNLATLRLDRCNHLKRIPPKLVQQGPLRCMEFTYCYLDDLPEGFESPGVLRRIVWQNNDMLYDDICDRHPELHPILFLLHNNIVRY